MDGKTKTKTQRTKKGSLKRWRMKEIWTTNTKPKTINTYQRQTNENKNTAYERMSEVWVARKAVEFLCGFFPHGLRHINYTWLLPRNLVFISAPQTLHIGLFGINSWSCNHFKQVLSSSKAVNFIIFQDILNNNTTWYLLMKSLWKLVNKK